MTQVISLCETKESVWSQNKEWSGRGNYLIAQFTINPLCSLLLNKLPNPESCYLFITSFHYNQENVSSHGILLFISTWISFEQQALGYLTWQNKNKNLGFRFHFQHPKMSGTLLFVYNSSLHWTISLSFCSFSYSRVC